MIPAVRRGAELVYGRSVGWAPAAAVVAEQVVVEVDEEAEDIGAPPITCEITRTVTARRPMTAPAPIDASHADRAIAGHVVSLLPPDATLQFGPGAVADVVVRAIDTPVRVWSGLLTDAVAELAARDLLACPGSRRLRVRGCTDHRSVPCRRSAPDRDQRDPRCSVHRRESRGSSRLNTALQVGLDGSVNVERVRGAPRRRHGRTSRLLRRRVARSRRPVDHRSAFDAPRTVNDRASGRNRLDTTMRRRRHRHGAWCG